MAGSKNGELLYVELSSSVVFAGGSVNKLTIMIISNRISMAIMLMNFTFLNLISNHPYFV